MFIIVSTAMPQLMIFSRHARQRFHERIVKKVEPGYDFDDFVGDLKTSEYQSRLKTKKGSWKINTILNFTNSCGKKRTLEVVLVVCDRFQTVITLWTLT
jgi:hypothetical protein